MGATSRQMPTRRRTSSVDMEPASPIIQQQSARSGYYSETTRRSYGMGINRSLTYDSYSSEHANKRTTRRRRSTGLYESSETYASPSKVPLIEEGEASEHDNSDPDEHDSHSSSAPSLEEGSNKGSHHSLTHRSQSYHNSSYHTNPNTPISTKRIRSLQRNGGDPELGSDSLHKRALHEAEMPASVLRGKTNTIKQTSSDDSEDSFVDYKDDSTKSRLTLDSHLEVGRGNSDGPQAIRTNFQITERILTSMRMLGTSNAIVLLLIASLFTMGVGLYTQSYATLSVTLDTVINNENERQLKVVGHFETIEKEMNGLQRQLLELHPDVPSLLSSASDTPPAKKQEAPKTDETVFEAIDAVKERIRVESSRISAFEKHIQATSLRDATRKYGTGVVRVELTLDFLSDRSIDQDREPVPQTLILEMAPLDIMPHSVYTFLEMVDNHLYDGCSFVINALGIIKVAPLPYEKGPWGSAKQMDQNFRKLGLETVSFREYSESYKHEQYTVGFAADGSPDFYINTMDNSEEHAGEPCFARIISGLETVAKMEAEPLRSGMWIKKRIGIKKATVL